jgi:hypothetical protein
MKSLLFILVLAGFLWAQNDSIQPVTPITKIGVIKETITGYDTTRIFLGACIDKKGNTTINVPQEIVNYIQKDTAEDGKERIIFNPYAANLRWAVKDYKDSTKIKTFIKDSLIVRAFISILQKELKKRITLK